MNLEPYQSSLTSYSHLSLKDLLDAQDNYHIHLMRHPRVIATAIGRYRIRHEDDWPNQNGEGKKHGKGKRTLENSEVRPYSWPAVLVFVDEWQSRSAFRSGGKYDPDEMVPSTLYLPDGRRVPVCVIEAPKEATTPAAPPVIFPFNNIGGGRPIMSRVQGRDHVATIACLVRDGHKIYGLTNHHVAGEAGEVLYTQREGRIEQVGVASSKHLTRIPFMDLYPGFVGKNVYVNLDIGLIEVDKVDDWTADIESIGTMGKMVDLSVHNLTLDLIGCHVRGHGSASGLMLGEIHALFYRYKSQGGFDYIADFFIGPRSADWQEEQKRSARRETNVDDAENKPFTTHPGDSGTLFLLEPRSDKQKPSGKNADSEASESLYRPIAVQWGENLLFSDSTTPQAYVLATCLSTVCNLLEIDPVRDWNMDVPETWGAVGHFSIATSIIHALSGNCPKLVELMTNNAVLIAPDRDTILQNDFSGMGKNEVVPLADVPDFYWQHSNQGHTRGSEPPNHFADMDQINSDGDDLLTLTLDPKNISPEKWNAFYDTLREILTDEPITQNHRGLLPFRVWQIFDAMVGFAHDDKPAEFVCAAGVLAHYLGDACQPLHVSYLHDGDPSQPVMNTTQHDDGTVTQKPEPRGVGIHHAYEADMVGAHRKDILDGLVNTPKAEADELIINGLVAAQKTIDLMRGTIAKLAPIDIVQAYIASDGTSTERAESLWNKFGTRTIGVMQNGTHLLAVLWESAWRQGDGENTVSSTPALTGAQAMNICANREFLPSYTIKKIASKLTAHEPA